MNFRPFDHASVAHHHNSNVARRQTYPRQLEDLLPISDGDTARSVIAQWNGYSITPLHSLAGLASELKVAKVNYKDESTRFGLGSFKALGGAYAVLRLLAGELPRIVGCSVGDKDIGARRFADDASRLTVVTATDGNHGRSVAWGAQQFGCSCRIYMHAGVSAQRMRAITDLGAEVIRINGNYDESVHQAAADAAANNWFVVSDTSYDGYVELPRQVLAGYTVMTSEIIEQLAGRATPTHVFVQGGVGGLAAAICSHFWQVFGADRPRFVIVEPDRADCLFQSAVNNRSTTVNIREETIMAGLSCGQVSSVAWEILSTGCDDFMSIPDVLVAPVMRRLADGCGDENIVAGESAVAGLAGLIAARRSQTLSDALGLDDQSAILVIGTEGATDPDIYESIVGRSASAVSSGR